MWPAEVQAAWGLHARCWPELWTCSCKELAAQDEIQSELQAAAVTPIEPDVLGNMETISEEEEEDDLLDEPTPRWADFDEDEDKLPDLGDWA